MPVGGEKASVRARVILVVVGFNNRGLLDECFESAFAQTYAAVGVIYVDNGSSDDSVSYIRSRHPRVDLIEAGENLGFAAGNNRGFARALEDASCEYVVALNTDARLAPTWVQTLVDFADSHPDAAGLQGATFNHERRDELDSFGIYISPIGVPTQLGFMRRDVVLADAEVFGVSAAAAMYTRTFLERQPFGTEYFDEDLFMYYEDVDLSARALALGMRNYVVAAAVAYHMYSASTAGHLSPFKIRMSYRNIVPVIIKNMPARLLPQLLVGRVLASMELFAGFVRNRRFGLALAIVEGQLQGLALIPSFLAKRRVLRAAGRDRDVDYEQLMSPPDHVSTLSDALMQRFRLISSRPAPDR
ncbi:MAG: glycosyltransferase family 2 protein [Solirubrobacteraceae bacterium]